MTRLKIQTLRGAGVLIDEVAELVGVSPRSVQRVAKEPPIEDVAAVDDAASPRMGLTLPRFLGRGDE
jgi:hypothetical protein